MKEEDETTEEEGKDMYSNPIDKNKFLSENFLSALNALCLTISSKPAAVIKSKSLLKSVIRIVSQVTEIDNIAIFYKKKRLLKVFAKIIKELSRIEEAKTTFASVLPLFCYIFSKIGKRRGFLLKSNLQGLHVQERHPRHNNRLTGQNTGN